MSPSRNTIQSSRCWSPSQNMRKNIAVVEYFREILPIPHQTCIMNLSKPPTTLGKWYKWAIKIQNNFLCIHSTISKTQNWERDASSNKKPNKSEPQQFFPKKGERDLGAMIINAMVAEEHEWMMKAGLCFKCKKPENIYWKCPGMNKTLPPSPHTLRRWRKRATHACQGLDGPDGRRTRWRIFQRVRRTGFLNERTASTMSTSVSPSLDIHFVTTTSIQSNILSMPIWISDAKVKNVETLGLIDSGAERRFIDWNFVKNSGFKIFKLKPQCTLIWHVNVQAWMQTFLSFISAVFSNYCIAP